MGFAAAGLEKASATTLNRIERQCNHRIRNLGFLMSLLTISLGSEGLEDLHALDVSRISVVWSTHRERGGNSYPQTII